MWFQGQPINLLEITVLRKCILRAFYYITNIHSYTLHHNQKVMSPEKLLHVAWSMKGRLSHPLHPAVLPPPFLKGTSVHSSQKNYGFRSSLDSGPLEDTMHSYVFMRVRSLIYEAEGCWDSWRSGRQSKETYVLQRPSAKPTSPPTDDPLWRLRTVEKSLPGEAWP